MDSLISLIWNVRTLTLIRSINILSRAATFDSVFGLLHGADFLVNRLAHCVALILHLLAFGVDGIA